MNDRFKFRFYDKEKKIIIDEHSNLDLLIEIYGKDEWWWCAEAEMPTILGYFDGDKWFKRDFEIMQCTGLKDKNGKLIYEGDILKDDENLLYEVTFKLQEYATGFSLKRREIPDYYPHITTWCGLGYRNCNKYEVIGNIYENADLLEDTECQK